MKTSTFVSTLSLLGSAAAWGFMNKAHTNGCAGPCEMRTSEQGIYLSCEDCILDRDLDDQVTKRGSAGDLINGCFTNKNGRIVPRDEGGGGGWDQSCKFKDVDGQGVIHADCKNDAQQWDAVSVKLSDAPLTIAEGGFWCDCIGCENEITV